jgi:hypothetical protein
MSGRLTHDALDPRAVEMACEPAHGGLDFGKLGHRAALDKRTASD